MIDFIGLGAQKSATSWIYANLYEHPEICIPIKELHFFSRDRFANGRGWYENHFSKCASLRLRGEFSTSYLYSDVAASRMYEMYPHAKLIAVLREPVARAFSQYRNAIKAGEIGEEVSFDSYIQKEKSALEQGLYAAQIVRYIELFPRPQILILIQDDIEKDPKQFMAAIYAFLGIDSSFVSSMLYKEINTARTPRAIGVDRTMHKAAEALRGIGFDHLVHMFRKSGIPDMVRRLNTKKTKHTAVEFDRSKYTPFFSEDVQKLSEITGRDLAEEWKIPV